MHMQYCPNVGCILVILEFVTVHVRLDMKSSQVLHTQVYRLDHRGLKLDGAIGQGEICNSLKSEIFGKSYLSHIGKNRIKF